MAARYWQMPETTAESFGADGWLSTGDVVEREPDGHLVLKARKKDMYIQGGFNVYPAEVEAVLATHPGVALAAGIGVPDQIYGEVGHYFVLAHPDAQLDPVELRKWCEERLASYKVPSVVQVVTELPLTPAGKVAKAELRQRLESGAAT